MEMVLSVIIVKSQVTSKETAVPELLTSRSWINNMPIKENRIFSKRG
jgi:hypothetical protein